MVEEKTDDDKQLFHRSDKESGKACFLKMDLHQCNKKQTHAESIYTMSTN